MATFDPNQPFEVESEGEALAPPTKATFDPSLPFEIEAKEKKLFTPEVKESPLQSALSYGRGVAQSMGQGLLAGAGDEFAGLTTAAAAGIGDFVTGRENPQTLGEIYRDARDAERQDLREFKEDNPVVSFGAEVLGSVPTALVGGAALKGAAAGTGKAAQLAQKVLTPAKSLGGVMKKGAAAGGAYGATYGAGTSEGESAGEILSDSAQGGIVGGAGGALIPAGIAGAGLSGKKAVDFVKKLRGKDKEASQRVFQNLADRAGLSVEEAMRRFDDLGDDAIMSDVHPSFLAQLKQSLDEVPEMREEVSDFLTKRQKGQGKAIKQDMINELGDIGGDSLSDAMDKLGKERTKQASPLYKEAFESGAFPDDLGKIEAFRNEGIQDALTEANRIIKQDVTRGRGSPVTPVERLHYAKKALWDRAQKLKREGANEEARLVDGQRKVIDEQLNKIPAYKQAREIWADSMDREAAADIGKTVFKNTVDAEDFARSIRGMTDSELQMVKLQAVKDANRKIGFKGETDNMTKMMTNPEQLAKMEALFGSKEAADRFAKKVSKWDRFASTKAEATAGSGTKRWLKESESGDIDAQAVLAPKLAALDFVKRKLRGKLTKEVHKELINKLAAHGLSPEEVTNMLTEGTAQEIEHRIANKLSVPVAAAVIPNKLSNGARKKVDRRGRKK